MFFLDVYVNHSFNVQRFSDKNNSVEYGGKSLFKSNKDC